MMRAAAVAVARLRLAQQRHRCSPEPVRFLSRRASAKSVSADDSASERSSGSNNTTSNGVVCYACGGAGHIASACTAPMYTGFKLPKSTVGFRRPHTPVLVEEILECLPPDAKTVVDCTFGAGGHTREILTARPRASVYACDCDPTAIAIAQGFVAETQRVVPVVTRFSSMLQQLTKAGCAQHSVDFMLMDLGVSSMQIDTADRGFSFIRDGPLDMRMGGELEDAGGVVAARDVVNSLGEPDLTNVLRVYGEERYAARIARAIVEARQSNNISTTSQLSSIVAEAVIGKRNNSSGGSHSHHHPATKTFQALRIFVNNELEELAAGLAAASRLLRPTGVLAVISFHSLEDRIVKQFLKAGKLPEPAPGFRRPSTDGVEFWLANKHVVTASDEEVERNPRSRSAKLRVAQLKKPPQAE